MKIKKISAFLHEAEKMKTILRHCWNSSGRQEAMPSAGKANVRQFHA